MQMLAYGPTEMAPPRVSAGCDNARTNIDDAQR